MSFVHLPPELLGAICGSADGRSVVRLRLVCRLLRDVVDGSLELQYRIELMRDGMVDDRTCPASPPSPTRKPSEPSPTRPSTPSPLALTIPDRLARLRQLRKAWNTLDWTRCVTVPMPGPCCAYELVGGMFCKTQPRARRGGSPLGAVGGGLGFGFGWPFVVDGAVIENGHGAEGGPGHGHGHGHVEGPGYGGLHETAHVHGSRTLSATYLPGRTDPGHTEVKDDLGIPTRDFAMDPSQDLMVLFKGGEEAGLPVMVVFPGTLELHVRTISTNQTHPDARVPVLCTPVMYPLTSVFVQIVDDVVGMMYCVDPARPRITIWNWKTGKLVVDRSSSCLPAGTWDFSFINNRALYVSTSNGGGALELFTFTCDGRAEANTNTRGRSQSESDALPQSRYVSIPTSPLVHVATLRLPPVHPSVRVLSVSSHTGPFLASCPPDKPFVASNEARIHVLTIQYMHLPRLDRPRPRPRVCLFVHNRTLQEYLERDVAAAAVGMGAGETMAVPWNEWGQMHTRMLPHVGMFQWLRYVHGQRVVMLLPTSEAGKSTLQVLDFNARNAFDEVDDQDNVNDNLSRRQARLELVTYPTRIFMPNVFADVVESRLPYREARRDVRGDYSGVMIDDERLVGLKYPAFLTGDMREIDVFTM